MKCSLSLTAVMLLPVMLFAQNVGVGTTNPSHKLSVNGSVLVDAGNQNYGTLDSAALRFGTTGAGIFSNRTSGTNVNGLDFWTGSNRKMVLTLGGFVGINISSPSYRLDVGGSIRSTGSIISESGLTADGSLDVNGNGRVGNYMAIGGSPTSTYRLYVNGNALINTNIGINGTLRADGAANLNSTLSVDGKITNAGKAIMLSNSSTTLRSGFTSGTFSISLAAGSSTDVTFIITPFTGNNNNVRVSVGQFAPGSGASNWGAVVMTAHSVLASDPDHSNNSTVKVRFQNAGSSTANLGTNAVLYLYSVVTH